MKIAAIAIDVCRNDQPAERSSQPCRDAVMRTAQNRAERNQAVWIVVDCGRLMRARIGSLSKLDFAVDAALNLAQVASFGGDRLALLAYGTRIQERMPPGR